MDIAPGSFIESFEQVNTHFHDDGKAWCWNWGFPSIQIYAAEDKWKLPNESNAFAPFSIDYDIVAPLEPFYLTTGRIFYLDIDIEEVNIDTDYGNFSLAQPGGIGG